MGWSRIILSEGQCVTITTKPNLCVDSVKKTSFIAHGINTDRLFLLFEYTKAATQRAHSTALQHCPKLSHVEDNVRASAEWAFYSLTTFTYHLVTHKPTHHLVAHKTHRPNVRPKCMSLKYLDLVFNITKIREYCVTSVCHQN